MSSPLFQALAFSHVVVPWLVVARRLRSRHALAPPPPAVAREELKAPNEAPTRSRKKDKRNRKAKPPEAHVDASRTPVEVDPTKDRKHERLLCVACGAPVRLAAAPFDCPHCAAEIVPPPDVIAAYGRIVWAKHALERAERAWRLAVLWNAPVWLVLFGLLFTAWAGAYFYLVITGPANQYAEWSKLEKVLYFASTPGGLFGPWLGLFLSMDSGKLKRLVADVPRGTFTSLPPHAAVCSHCGAAVTFADGRFTALCAYCGSEEIRPSLAREAAREARSVGRRAGRSIIEAYRAIVARRERLFRFFDLLAAFQIVLVLFEAARWVPVLRKWLDWIGQFA